MVSAAAPPPIAGTPIDPPPKAVPGYAEQLDRTVIGGIGYRALRRYSFAKVGLLAAGTAYYLFLALLSLVAFAFGLFAVIGSDTLAQSLTDSLSQALPGLVGEGGIDPAQLRAAGATAGVVGLVLMLYGSLGAVGGASSSMHLVYGAPPDPRNFAVSKLRHLGILLVAAPLIAVSFSTLTIASQVGGRVLAAAGLDSDAGRVVLTGVALLIGLAVDTLILYFFLGTLGGIKPNRRPRLIAAVLGAFAAAVIKQFLGLIISWSLDKPQYGALALPLAVLFVLSLFATLLYGSAALAAGISDSEVPLQELAPTPQDVAAPGADT